MAANDGDFGLQRRKSAVIPATSRLMSTREVPLFGDGIRETRCESKLSRSM
jgi:hypothetical protein